MVALRGRQMALLLYKIASTTNQSYMSRMDQHLAPKPRHFPAGSYTSLPMKYLLGVDRTIIGLKLF